MIIKAGRWITPSRDFEDIAPVFRRAFTASGEVKQALLEVTALGVYESELNGRRVGDFILAPGWTSYSHRLQVQRYDVTSLLNKENDLRITVGRGWFRSAVPDWHPEEIEARRALPCGLIACLRIRYAAGEEELIPTDEEWTCAEGPVRFSEIYDGETFDARVTPAGWQKAALLKWSRRILIPQEGDEIRETERVAARQVFTTPRGEIVVDFGQEVTGYVEFTLEARSGDQVYFNHGEVLDREGNFYNENYRSAKAEVRYICRDGIQTWHPRLTFFGFRYIHLINWPGEAKPENFTAVAVHSDMKQTGFLSSGNPELNQLFSNIIWGQRGNFLDIPTDCPQRNERLGWTGDAEVFVRAAAYFYDVERFFRKWLHDLSADQFPDGGVGSVVPNVVPRNQPSAAWGDAATICPWQIYQTYGDPQVLEDQFESMKKWVDYITSATTTPSLWTGGTHFADWLGLDAPEGSYKGSTREDFIATAFYARSTELLVQAGKVLGKDMSSYEALYGRILAAFRKTFPDCRTQTEHVLAVHFRLAENPGKTADDLAAMVCRDGKRLRTGFVGTPYLLHALTDFGHGDLAWDLLLRREYPGWLYPVTRGATTIWEHWDGIREDGSFWSADMNSFNHYAYGAVADWVFEQAAGLSHDTAHPGFSELIYQPHPDPRIGWLEARLETRSGQITASWHFDGKDICYELQTPVPVRIRLKGEERKAAPGHYFFRERLAES